MPGAIRPSIKIGLVAPFEGRYRYIGYDVIYAARLAVREINAIGGVGGYSIELVAYDDGAQPAAASACVAKLDADASVVAAIAHFSEDVSAAVVADYLTAKMPLVSPASYDHLPAPRDGLIYALAPPAQAVADAIIGRLMPSAPSAIGLVTVENGLARALRLEAARRGIPLQPDVSPLEPGFAVTVASGAPDAVILNVDPTTAGEVAQALRLARWTGVLAGGHALTPADYRAVAGSAAEAICVTPWPSPDQVAGAGGFIERYMEVSGGVPPGRLALPAYESTWLVIEAIEQSIKRDGNPSRGGVAVSLSQIERTGLLGSIAFGGEGNWQDAPLHPCAVRATVSE